MSKQSLLLVDGDTRSLRVLEVSLRKAGFSVTPAVSVGDALDKLEVNAPDLIISETKFATELDGFELRRRLRGTPDWASIPFIFLTAETAIENKIKGLELGVDDYLTKPIYIKEIVTRINILLQKRQRQFLDLRKDGTRFAGHVADMPVVDVIQTIEVSRKSGVIQFSGGPNRQAAIYFRDGKVIDAEAGTLQGEDAVYRLLTWNDGDFEVEFRTVRRREAITTSSQGLLMEGMRRLDEWSRLLEQLPPLTHRFEIDAAELSTRLGEVPDDNNRILRLFDSKRTLIEVIDASDFGDLECIQAISRLYFEGLLIDLDPGVRSKRETGKPMPLIMVEASPMQYVASGPIDLAALQERAFRDEIVEPDLATDMDTAPVREEPDGRARRDSGELVVDDDVLDEEEAAPIRGPLMGGYRPSSLRLIDEAVAAAQAIEPSLFEPEELIAAGVTVPPVAEAETPLARVKLAARTSDPRIDTARDLIERTKPHDETNGRGRTEPSARSRKKTLPPPIPRGVSAKAILDREIAEAPLLEAELYTSGEHPIPSEDDLADVPLLEAEPYTSGEFKIPSNVISVPAEAAAAAEADMAAEAAAEALAAGARAAEARAAEAFAAEALASEARASEARAAAEPTEAKPSEPASAQLSAKPGKVTLGWDAVEEPAATPSAEEVDTVAEAIAAEATADQIPQHHARAIARIAMPEAEDDSGVPTAIAVEDSDEISDEMGERPTDPTRKRAPKPLTPDDSQGLRMIGSHGKDRAEAAGELRPPAPTPAEPTEPQRELVTILPRRITREIAVPSADAEANAGGKAETKPNGKAAEAKPAKSDGGKPAVEPPARPPPRRVSVEGGVVRQETGPGRGAKILIALAALLGSATLVSYCARRSKPTKQPVAVVQDASTDHLIEMETPDATDYVVGFGVDAAVAMTPLIDAAVARVPVDAATVAVVPRDASVAVVPADARVTVAATADAGVDKGKEARALYNKGHLALEDGDPEQALELLDQSLKLARAARTLLARARALQRLGRIDDAVASIDDAIALNKGSAAAYEQKGMVLWSAQRYAEARPALETFLELNPDSPKAETIRSMLNEQK